jgi:hypothetical protein
MLHQNSKNNIVCINYKQIHHKWLVSKAQSLLGKFINVSDTTIDIWHEAVMNMINEKLEN